jgi:hypothetical protein
VDLSSKLCRHTISPLSALSPASTRSTTAATASAKTAEAATSAAPASTTTPSAAGAAPASAASSATHGTDHGSDPPATSHSPGSSTASIIAAIATTAKQNDEQGNAKDEPDPQATGILVRWWRLHLRHAGEGYTLFVRDVLRQFPGSGSDASVIIALAEKRDHGAASVAGASIIYHRLQAVTDLRPILPVVWRHEQHHTIVLFLLSDSELLEKVVRVGLYVIAIQRFDGDDRELRAGFLFEFGGEGFQLRFSLWLNDTCEICYVAGGAQVLEVVGEGDADHG